MYSNLPSYNNYYLKVIKGLSYYNQVHDFIHIMDGAHTYPRAIIETLENGPLIESYDKYYIQDKNYEGELITYEF